MPNNDVLMVLTQKTAAHLSNHQEKLRNICWSDGEANLDTEYSQLACRCCTTAWLDFQLENPCFTGISIECQSPDINITFSEPDAEPKKFKIELKSCKGEKLALGSTIGTLNPNIPLIYCLRQPDGTCRIRWSQYHVAMNMGPMDTFNDRTPRPPVIFDRMNEITQENVRFVEVPNPQGRWYIPHYAECALRRINNGKNTWQDEMIRHLKQMIIREFIQNTTPKEFEEIKKSQ